MVANLFASASNRNRLSRIDPRIKLSGTLCLLLLITASQRYAPLAPPALLLLALIGLSGLPLRQHLRQLRIILPFMIMLGLLFLLSFFLQTGTISPPQFLASPLGNSYRHILAKSTLALLLLGLLIQTTALNDLLWAMRRFRIPRIVTTLSNLTLVYLNILSGETERIVRARNSRLVAKNRHPLQALAQIGSSVFLRSFARADQLYKAMLARGFHGEYPDLHRHRIGVRDSLAILTVLIVTVSSGLLWNR